ncbi:hypothetical protein GCM10025767_09890 [Thalassotalea piscium]|uniref:Uncharacterized protein n=1 Tax=Thalassotalea piscium TaxID=1230533 RepID=A0A7X0NFK1_9GAMM|nr:hypothetical protein [Thalassotalea piscium]
MSAGMSAAWRAKQQKPKRCQRCELYYSASLDTCDQCATLSEAQLTLFKIKRQKILQKMRLSVNIY